VSKDRQASTVINQLFETWYPHLLRYACGQVKQRSTAEELVQDVFLDLYQALLAGQSIRFPKAWTLCVLRRKANEFQANRLGASRPHECLDCIPDLTGSSDHPNLDWVLDCQRLRQHLNVLSSREEEVILLRLQAMKHREIASALGISINSVNQYLARAIEKLQRVMTVKNVGRQKKQL
jgi:RNA polymerase sigma-70 factor (ECF subfamily)